MFTAYFMAWDADVKVRTTADYDKRVAELKAQQAAGAAAAAEDSKPSWAKPDAEEAPSAEEAPAACVAPPANETRAEDAAVEEPAAVECASCVVLFPCTA